MAKRGSRSKKKRGPINRHASLYVILRDEGEDDDGKLYSIVDTPKFSDSGQAAAYIRKAKLEGTFITAALREVIVAEPVTQVEVTRAAAIEVLSEKPTRRRRRSAEPEADQNDNPDDSEPPEVEGDADAPPEGEGEGNEGDDDGNEGDDDGEEGK